MARKAGTRNTAPKKVVIWPRVGEATNSVIFGCNEKAPGNYVGKCYMPKDEAVGISSVTIIPNP